MSAVPDEPVSVLFSEPKISQFAKESSYGLRGVGFSALQRAENFSMLYRPSQLPPPPGFSALQRAENFSMREAQSFYHPYLTVSVLFSEPKISQ